MPGRNMSPMNFCKLIFFAVTPKFPLIGLPSWLLVAAMDSVLGRWHGSLLGSCDDQLNDSDHQCSGVLSDQVAEHTVVFDHCLTRSFGTFFRQQQQKIYVRKPTRDLTHSTVGIIGFGGVCRRLSEVLAPFKTRILAVDLSLSISRRMCMNFGLLNVWMICCARSISRCLLALESPDEMGSSTKASCN